MAQSMLTTLILAIVAEEPSHGYAIARAIEARSEDALSFGEGALYPALRALETAGHVEPEWDRSTTPARKVYAITESGRAELARRRVEWLDYVRSVNGAMGWTGKEATR